MSQYEDVVELGFEGVDKLTDKYHDKVYGHLPAFKKRQADQQRQQQKQHNQPNSVNEQQRERHDSTIEGSRSIDKTEPDMSSYGAQYDRRQDYRDERDVRYVDEAFYYQGANAGAVALVRDRGPIGKEFAPSPAGYAYDDRYNDPRASYDDQYRYYPQQPHQGRPDMSRQRSNSWSPRDRNRDRDEDDRRGRDRDQESRHRNRRDRSNSSPNLKEPDIAKRLAAAAVGALVGGFAANKFSKGKPYDTAATFGGAVLGGIASREIADRVGHKKDEKRGNRDDEEKAWEQKWGKDEKGRDDRDRDDYRDDYRDDRDRRRIRD